MKKICIILFAGLLVSAGLQAQEVYIEDGKVILDMRETTGMPAGAITATHKTWDNPVSGNYLSGNREKETINATVFQKLEIAPDDLEETNWLAAFYGCRALAYNGSGWRLPTQRELMMMWIFNDALNDVLPAVSGDALSTTYYYWSATESSASNAWIVSFGSGLTSYNVSKELSYHVRCVREVTN